MRVNYMPRWQIFLLLGVLGARPSSLTGKDEGCLHLGIPGNSK